MYDVLALHEAKEGDVVFHKATLVTRDGEYPIDDRYGSWRVHIDGKIRDLIPPVAADLQAEVGGSTAKRR